MAGDDLDVVLNAVGPRLRDLRLRRDLTLADVAVETGISLSTLSRLESGTRRPSLDLLLPLAQIYHVPLDDLVGAPLSGDPRVYPKPIRRHGWIYLPLSRRPFGVQAFKIILPGRSQRKQLEENSHEGYEWIYVLAGRVQLKLSGVITTVQAGEAAEFDTRTPHGFASASDEPAEVISLFSPEGERIHVRDS